MPKIHSPCPFCSEPTSTRMSESEDGGFSRVCDWCGAGGHVRATAEEADVAWEIIEHAVLTAVGAQ